jgi:phosphate/sulfate permease
VRHGLLLMTLPCALALVTGFVLAAANGANDTSKGIATLVGAGLADVDRATAWGVGWTAFGGVAGALLAPALLVTFGPGLLASDVVPTLPAALSSLGGAVLWVALATRFGLPVSTTHGIVGAVAGSATAAYGLHGFAWGVVGTKVVLPLVLGPVVALAVGAALVALSPRASGAWGDRVHWTSSAAVCAARAMNDTPKIAALVLAATSLAGTGHVPVPAAFGVVVLGMVLGGAFAGRAVTRRLATGMVALDHDSGLGANVVAAVLVGLGAFGGLPLSTTHVASGGIVGAGLGRGPKFGALRDIALAWVITAPGAALLAASIYALAGVIA